MFHVKHNSADTLSTTTAHRCSISLHAYISAMKRYGVRQPLQEFEKFLEMFWLCYAWKITLFERQRVCDFLRMYLTDRLSHRTTERRSRCRMPYLIQLRER